MDIKELIGEATEYDKSWHLRKRNQKVGVKVLARLQIHLAGL